MASDKRGLPECGFAVDSTKKGVGRIWEFGHWPRQWTAPVFPNTRSISWSGINGEMFLNAILPRTGNLDDTLNFWWFISSRKAGSFLGHGDFLCRFREEIHIARCCAHQSGIPGQGQEGGFKLCWARAGTGPRFLWENLHLWKFVKIWNLPDHKQF